jgi:hypothetical protein
VQGRFIQEKPHVVAGTKSTTIALRVVGDDENGTQYLGVNLSHPDPGRYKYSHLALQVGRVWNLRQ